MNMKLLCIVYLCFLSGMAAAGNKEQCQKHWNENVKKAQAIINLTPRETHQLNKSQCHAHLILDASAICPKVGVVTSTNFYKQNKYICKKHDHFMTQFISY